MPEDEKKHYELLNPSNCPTMASLRSFGTLTLLCKLATIAFAIPSLTDLVLHEARTIVPRGFKMMDTAPPDMRLGLRIALKQKDADGLEKRLYEVSTPGKETYGKYLSKAEVSIPESTLRNTAAYLYT